MFSFFLRLAIPLVLAGTLACGPRLIRQKIHSSADLTVLLRHEVKDGEPLDRGFRHPTAISESRLANILSRVDVRSGGAEKRVPAIPLDLLYPIADFVSQALGQADPSQEVVVSAIHRTRKFAIITNKYLTSMIIWVDGDRLVIHLGHVSWQVPKDPNTKIPEPVIAREYQEFRVASGSGLVAIGPQTVAAFWRDDDFGKSRQLTVSPGGKLQRRTILMEAPEGSENAPRPPSQQPLGSTGESTPDAADAATLPEPAPPLRDGLSPEALRALADLEEERRDGEITEIKYQERRRQILRGDAEVP